MLLLLVFEVHLQLRLLWRVMVILQQRIGIIWREAISLHPGFEFFKQGSVDPLFIPHFINLLHYHQVHTIFHPVHVMNPLRGEHLPGSRRHGETMSDLDFLYCGLGLFNLYFQVFIDFFTP